MWPQSQYLERGAKPRFLKEFEFTHESESIDLIHEPGVAFRRRELGLRGFLVFVQEGQ